jgi:hypothetical protein
MNYPESTYKDNISRQRQFYFMQKKYDKELYPSYITKLRLLGKIEDDDYDMALGIHFEIPKCCIKNFIYISSIGVSKIVPFMNKFYGKDDSGVQYVKCPRCRRKV